MGYRDCIYGVIYAQVPGGARERAREELRRRMIAAPDLLPREDDYPALTRNMVALTSPGYETPGLYRWYTLHLGLTVKDVAEHWHRWLDKFESYLRVLPACQARLHLELERPPVRGSEQVFAYRWSLAAGQPPDRESSWDFRGGPREFGVLRRRAASAKEKLERQLAREPRDAQSLVEMISVCAEIGRFDEAQSWLERLAGIDEEQASRVPLEWLQPWSERCLGRRW